MALKLIREAHLASTLSKDELKALSIIKEATGKDTIASVLNEAFTPTADDFDAWMRVVVGEAQDRGINLNKRAEFMQLVMDVLENDPANPPFEMQEAIAKKLWADYKAAKDEVRINKMAAAREEEEQAEKARKLIASRYAQGPAAVLPQAGEDEESGFVQAFNAAKGTEEEEVADFLKRGGTIQHVPARRPRKAEKWQGSAHIGKASERPGRSTTGKSANTMGRPVIGLSKVGTEEEESGKNAWREGYHAYHTGKGNPYDRGTRQYNDWQTGYEDAQYERHGHEEEEEEGEWFDRHGRPNPNGAYDAGGHYHAEREAGQPDGDDRLRRPNPNMRVTRNNFEDEEDSMSFLKDVINDRGEDRGEIDRGSFSSHLRGDDDGFDEYDDDGDATFNPDEYSVDDEDVFTSDDEDNCSCDDEDDVDDEVVGEDDLDSEDMGPPDEEVDVDVKREEPEKAYSEEEAVKSFFRQAATAPRSMMTQAIKDIEDEGKKAWTSSNVPKNPHPQKSAAYRAWQRGMLAAAKDALGIQDKPKDPKAKAKKKK